MYLSARRQGLIFARSSKNSKVLRETESWVRASAKLLLLLLLLRVKQLLLQLILMLLCVRLIILAAVDASEERDPENVSRIWYHTPL